MDEALLKRVRKYADHFEKISNVDACVLNLVDQDFFEGPPDFCRDSCPCKAISCNCFQVHFRNCLEAKRWDGRYTYYCPLNLMFVAAFCTTNTGVATGIVAGPFLLDEFDQDAFPGLSEEALAALKSVPIMDTKKSYHFGETLAALLTCCGVRDRGFSPTEHRWDTINEMFRFALNQGGNSAQTGYSIEMERRLGYLIAEGDGDAARHQISQLFSIIALSSGDSLERVRSRCLELLVVISRSAITAGAEIETAFSLNEKYFQELYKCVNPEDMGVLVASAAGCFASCVAKSSCGKYSYAISKAVNYIRQNYAGKITLEETAKMVFLSRSYFSKLFAEETGTTFSNYVNKTRIEKSKQLLLNEGVKLADVAYVVGFIDQSYFTKCFHKIVGVSPGKYLNNHGILEGGAKNYEQS